MSNIPNPVIESLQNPSGVDNIGGCRNFWFTPVEHVQAMPQVFGITAKTDVTFKSGRSWLAGYSTYKKLRFSEKMEKNDSGEYFLTEITGFYPKLLPEHTSRFKSMRFGRFIVKTEDNNGNIRISGTIDEPLEFAFDQDTGDSPATLNGHVIRFMGRQKEESPFYVAP